MMRAEDENRSDLCHLSGTREGFMKAGRSRCPDSEGTKAGTRRDK